MEENIYGLSERAKARFEELDRLNIYSPSYGRATGSVGRQTIHVRITGDVASGYYPAVPCAWDGTAWVEYDPVKAFDPNDNPLVVDAIYQATRYNDNGDGVTIFATSAREEPGCGLKYETASGDDKGKLRVDLEAVFGDGFDVPEEDCPLVTVKAGCGIDVDADGVAVNVLSLAGCGLDVQPPESGSTCSKLRVDCAALVGCGLEVQAPAEGSTCSKIAVDCGSLAGCGLMVASESGYCDQLEVDVASLVGLGLALQPVASGQPCDALKINEGCGLDFDTDGKLIVDNTALVGTGLTADGTCAIKVNDSYINGLIEAWVCANSTVKTVVTAVACVDGSLSITTEDVRVLTATCVGVG